MAQEMAKRQVVVKYGPYGSEREQNWCMVLEENERITQLIVRHGYVVDEIGFVIAKQGGCTYTKRFGNKNSGTVSKIVLKCGEYVTKISGTYGNYSGSVGNRLHISALKIHTNLCPSGYGPYGLNRVDNKRNFSSPLLTNGQAVIGFFGMHGSYIESIGVIAKDPSCSCSC